MPSVSLMWIRGLGQNAFAVDTKFLPDHTHHQSKIHLQFCLQRTCSARLCRRDSTFGPVSQETVGYHQICMDFSLSTISSR